MLAPSSRASYVGSMLQWCLCWNTQLCFKQARRTAKGYEDEVSAQRRLSNKPARQTHFLVSCPLARRMLRKVLSVSAAAGSGCSQGPDPRYDVFQLHM